MSTHLDNEGVRVQAAPTCPLCRQTGPVLYDKMRDRLFDAPGVWSLRRCGACDILWLDPRPVAAEIGRLYETYLTHDAPEERKGFSADFQRGALTAALGYAIGGSWLGRALAWAPPVRDRAAAMMMWLRAERRGRLLDIGCGNGNFLARAQTLGWDVAGIEPDHAAARVAHDRLGIEIIAPTLAEAALGDASFDAITLAHVIEHLLDPLATLRECARILKPGGRLVVTTPNTESLGHRAWKKSWVGLDPPRHVVLFSRAALQRLTKQAGLQLVELRTVARFASWMWAASRGIARNGRFPLEKLAYRGFPAWFWGLTVLGLEDLGVMFSNVGEEILLVATRPPARRDAYTQGIPPSSRGSDPSRWG